MAWPCKSWNVAGRLAGADISVDPGEGQALTPPLSFEMVHSGRLKSDGSEVTVERLELGLSQDERVLISAELSDEATLNFAERTQDSTRSDGAAGQAVSLLVTLNDLGEADLRPWAESFDIEGLEPVSACFLCCVQVLNYALL